MERNAKILEEKMSLELKVARNKTESIQRTQKNAM